MTVFGFLTEPSTPNGPEIQPGVEEVVADKEEEGSEDEWEQVGPRNKTSITRQADFIRTPITDIFGGHIRLVDCLLCRVRLIQVEPSRFFVCVCPDIGDLPPQSFRITVTVAWLWSSVSAIHKQFFTFRQV